MMRNLGPWQLDFEKTLDLSRGDGSVLEIFQDDQHCLQDLSSLLVLLSS